MRCPVCNNESLVKFCNINLQNNFPDETTTIYKCLICYSLCRSFEDYVKIKAYLHVADFNDNKKEEIWRKKRIDLFMQINQIINLHIGYSEKTINLLDVGCSHGHMIELIEKKINCAGVEPVAHMREKIARRGITVYPDIDNVPRCCKYNIVTFIDSLYYFQSPINAINQSVLLLKDDGILIIRITNRSFLFRAASFLCSNNTCSQVFGDQYIAFSHKGILSMLKNANLTIENIYFFERRTITNVKEFIFYRILSFFAAITNIPVSPGIIYVARNKNRNILP